MPWPPSKATSHTKKATTGTLKKLWSEVANKSLASGKSEGASVRIANYVVKKRGRGG